jgi:ubiquinone/menaquinone biosynthesis C-methylase UbiE
MLRSVTGAGRYLSPEQAAAVYDRVGRWQDTQSCYEHSAVEALVHAARFDRARYVVEIGCGTGALAERLLEAHLRNAARYVALDVSPKMVALTQQRLRRWAERVRIDRIDGRGSWPLPDSVADRVVATYVLDLLAPPAIEAFFAEARRVLRAQGVVATASLAAGTGRISGLVSAGWSRLWQINPHLTAGCRPVDVASLLPASWRVDTARTITSWAIPSTVLVAERLEN